MGSEFALNVMPLIMMVVLGAAFWFMVMRPAKARQQAQRALVNELKVGQEIMTTAGLFGTVREITDGEIKLEIADGVVVRYVKEAIAKVVEPVDPPASEAPAEELQDKTVVLDSRPAVETQHN